MDVFNGKKLSSTSYPRSPTCPPLSPPPPTPPPMRNQYRDSNRSRSFISVKSCQFHVNTNKIENKNYIHCSNYAISRFLGEQHAASSAMPNIVGTLSGHCIVKHIKRSTISNCSKYLIFYLLVPQHVCHRLKK